MVTRALIGVVTLGIAAITLILLLSAVYVSTGSDIEKDFTSYLQVYGKEYSAAESSLRFRIYTESAAYVKWHNSQRNSFKLALNSFADLTNTEFTHMLGYSPDSTPIPLSIPFNSTAFLPNEVNWRDIGAVGPVRDQRNCGACYAFAAVGLVEAAEYLRTGVLRGLSTQELVDCSVLTGNRGCKGGKITSALRYIERNGITLESTYPYVHYEHQDCLSLPNSPKIHISSHISVPKADQLQLKAAVSVQPVAVAIQADQPFFRLYSQGVIDRACGSHLNHAVLLVGYGTTPEGIDYWLVRNSWGTSWGEAGYVKILREDEGKDEGACGITLDASYVTTSPARN